MVGLSGAIAPADPVSEAISERGSEAIASRFKGVAGDAAIAG
jgi:hypothetical protein